MKYKSSEPKKLAIEVQFHYLFIQQTFAGYLQCSSVCCNDKQQKWLLPALRSYQEEPAITVKCDGEAQGAIVALGRDQNLPSLGGWRKKYLSCGLKDE